MTGTPVKPGILGRLRDEVADVFEKTADRLRGHEQLERRTNTDYLPEPTIGDTLLDTMDSLWPGRIPALRHPPIEIENLDKEVVVRAEVPGYSEKELDVEATENRLVIRGRSAREKHEPRGGGDHHASWTKTFTRAITLPAPVQTGKVSASYKNGLLTITLPKTPEARTRSVRVRVD